MIDDPETPDVGPTREGEATVWRVWAPRASRVELVLDPGPSASRVPMESAGRGYFVARTPRADPGRRYAFSLDGGSDRPDPASRWQPDGVNAPSAVHEPGRFAWTDASWTGVARQDLVFYELHVGTFTPEGTFDAVIPRLDSLRDLGVTAVELMPVTQFPGERSWGYDGVHPLAVQHSYGGPEGLLRLVDACHRRGLAVFLDVVFNHFGPEGNVLPDFGAYLTDEYRTDWGPAVNFDRRECDPVRALVRQAVRQWVRDFHVDGLRFDAADQIYDRSPRHVLADLAEVAHREGLRRGVPVHVFAETDLNDAPRFLHGGERGGYGFDGHWNDDFHHAVHTTLSGESNGYYADFTPGPAALAKALGAWFVNNGNYSEFRGRRHGTSADEFLGDRFVAFTQNHDQVGNRLKSDRNGSLVSPAAARLAAGLLLLSPRLPLLFMGEEYRETNPFPFFCDFRDLQLIEAVRKGRKAEFAYFGWDAEVPDPVAPETRARAVLSWDWSDPVRAGTRRLYAELLRLRRAVPALRDFRRPVVRLEGDAPGQVLVSTRGADGPEPVTILFNLTQETVAVPPRYADVRPWFCSDATEFGGEGNTGDGRLGGFAFVILGDKAPGPAPQG